MVKLSLKKNVTRFRIARKNHQDPWGTAIFVRRRLFLKSLRQYFNKIQKMKQRRNFANVLLLDKSRGKIRQRTSRKSLYGKMLFNKNKLQKFYNIKRNKQLRKLIRKNVTSKSNLKHTLAPLELRIDNLLRRCYFAPTIHWARQAVVHKHFKLNNKIFTKPSTVLSIYKTFSLNRECYYYYNIKTTFVNFSKHIRPLPSFLLIDYKALRFFIISYPLVSNIFYPFNGDFTYLINFYQNRKS